MKDKKQNIFQKNKIIDSLIQYDETLMCIKYLVKNKWNKLKLEGIIQPNFPKIYYKSISMTEDLLNNEINYWRMLPLKGENYLEKRRKILEKITYSDLKIINKTHNKYRKQLDKINNKKRTKKWFLNDFGFNKILSMNWKKKEEESNGKDRTN